MQETKARLHKPLSLFPTGIAICDRVVEYVAAHSRQEDWKRDLVATTELSTKCGGVKKDDITIADRVYLPKANLFKELYEKCVALDTTKNVDFPQDIASLDECWKQLDAVKDKVFEAAAH